MGTSDQVSGAGGAAAHAHWALLGSLRDAHRRVNAWVARRQHPARNIEIRTLLDTFFVCAITTILVIRLQLWATNYPKLGGGKLHIAHLLWGGLGMLVAIVLLLSFIGAARRHTGAVLGGIGFGFFIDEIGKFVTSDNDYFFKPAAGMIYIVFIILFLAIRSLGWRHRWTPQECLANAMQLMASQPTDQHRRHLVRELLARCEQTEPLVVPLTEALDRLDASPPRPPGRLARTAERLRGLYADVVTERWFPRVMVIVLVGFALATLAEVIVAAGDIWSGKESLHVITVAGLASSLVATGLIAVGMVKLRESRIEAYRWFDHALLVQVFFTEVFAFLEDQFGAVFGLLLNVALLLILRTMIHAEHRMALLSDDPLDPSATSEPLAG